MSQQNFGTNSFCVVGRLYSVTVYPQAYITHIVGNVLFEK